GDLWHTIKPKNTGVLGMGIGSVCGLRNADEHITYYEIDPQIVELARTQFDYDARCSNTSIILGDARLELAAQDAQGFDLLVVDTFSSDAIPVHLLTLEALKLYKHHLKPGGVIAINISNRYLDLLPVVAAISREAGLSWRSYYKGARRNELQEYAEEGVSHWVMLTSDAAKLNRLDVAKWQRQEVKAVRPWTDDYSNLLGTLGAD
ncbi:MAG: spermidine synthase, partial [Bdellovibrionales bacterium]